MTTPIAILLGIVIIAILVFAAWYLNSQAQRAMQQNRATGGQAIGQGIGQIVGGALSFIN